ncbi:hypothetical protein MPC4_100137 [Methylocella tundrae]|uniref:Uncharacterized protein n=1 Tax=Methylocella tundrae TaxID=227605 RepID=A0A8B6M1R7_METTU|nr:hypothetical protein MPC1_8970002 [Methylocella tundrae]VTZ48694.1 hypothetical protein MPC4_100137 [Methylocella tundrae]
MCFRADATKLGLASQTLGRFSLMQAGGLRPHEKRRGRSFWLMIPSTAKVAAMLVRAG